MPKKVRTAVWSSEEVSAAGDAVLACLVKASPRTLDELIAILGRKRGLLRIAGSVLERAGKITIDQQGDVIRYSLTT